jgi:hypothetical protein
MGKNQRRKQAGEGEEGVRGEPKGGDGGVAEGEGRREARVQSQINANRAKMPLPKTPEEATSPLVRTRTPFRQVMTN